MPGSSALVETLEGTFGPSAGQSRSCGAAAAVILTAAIMAVAATAPFNGVRVGSIALADVFLVCAAGALLLRWVEGTGKRMAVPPRPWVTGLVLMMTGGMVGTFFASDPGASLAQLARLGISSVIPVLVVLSWQPDGRQMRLYTWLWVTAASVSGAIALVAVGDASGRSAGLTTHPNHLAFISAMGAGLAFALALSERAWRRVAAVTALTFLTLAVLRAGSRAGLVVLTVTVTVVIIQNRRLYRERSTRGNPALILFSTAVACSLLLSTGMVSLGPHNAISRTLGDATTPTSNDERSDVLASGLRSVARRPFTGAGMQYALQAHNVYLQMAVSAGVLGLLGFLLVAATTVRAGLSHAWLLGGDVVAAGFVAGYAGYLVGALFQNILWDRYLWLHVAMIVWSGERSRRATALAEPCA